MDSNNETLFTRLSSFSSRASKIPQRIQSSLFSLRPSISTHEARPPIHQSKSDSGKPYYSLPKNTERKPRTTLDFTRLEQTDTYHEAYPLPPYNSSNSSSSSLSVETNNAAFTISEWIERLEEKCLFLLINSQEPLMQEIVEDSLILLDACELERRVLEYTTATSLVKKVQEICQLCAAHQSVSYCVQSDQFIKEIPRILKTRPIYEEIELDSTYTEATWFRNYFIGRPYVTLVDSVEGIITVVQEIPQSRYRVIFRGKGLSQACHLVSESTAKETQQHLESKGRRFLAFKKESESSTRLMRAAILSVCPHLDLRSFKELSAESTHLAGLEKDLLRYDELAIPEHYKFGLLNVKNGQTTERSWLRNTGLSKNLQDFLNILGDKVSLKGYKGYAAGLDKKAGEAGEFTYVSKWKGREIAFHVGPMMPFKKNDDQQVLRKRYIGNDIVSIIFIEEDQPFDPKAILSNFVFVYIVIHPELVQGKRQWRVEVIKNKNIDSFDPPIPSPPLFNDQDLKTFLTLKMIRAESASLRSERLSTPTNKARLGLLNTYIKHALSFQCVEKKPRQKSVNHKSRLLQKAMNSDLVTTSSADIPPIIPIQSSSTRSTLLGSFNAGFSRRRSKEPAVERKTSKLNILIKTDQNLLVGQNIQLSSESFISTEQLFGSSLIEEK